ncbi:uncharacterized protein AB675_5236 [Cyphellophora attinorum]|uniref:Uncharacterized protein n=1 Tax=Cyphellophora attinorum TaxID=1664694 RepID=A0A0N1HNS4_9EURO|nr:uncharacterized protein AB675_5236 [Phialophora attinorum]KPI39243.1 hypothetical protein AB675_5236 [Phialophora attinorum]
MSPPPALRLLRPIQLSHHLPRHLTLRPGSISITRWQNRTYASQTSDDQREAQLDRKKMNTESQEYGSTDDASASNEEAAFDPNITSPEKAKEKAGEGNDANPLAGSAADPDLSQPTSEVEGGADKKVSEGGGGRKAPDEGKGSESV